MIQLAASLHLSWRRHRFRWSDGQRWTLVASLANRRPKILPLIARFHELAPCPFLPDQEGSRLPSPNPIFLLSSTGERRRTRLPRKSARHAPNTRDGVKSPAAVEGDDAPGQVASDRTVSGRPLGGETVPRCVVGVGVCTSLCVRTPEKLREGNSPGRATVRAKENKARGTGRCACGQRCHNGGTVAWKVLHHGDLVN
jgi:hypothetical protein